ncbi:MAG: cupin domain-containing protein [Salibacteraceae bacterium]
MEVINVKDKLAKVKDHWSPKIICQLNGQQIKIAKVKGEFVWHHHDLEDELFYVLEGEIEIQFEDHAITIRAGEMAVVPKGIKHKPVAIEEASILLFEPAETLHTGGIEHQLRQDDQHWI